MDCPTCPSCGCPETIIIEDCRPGGWFASGKAECTYCGAEFQFTYTMEAERPAE
jgi:hypothetical protein